MTVSSSSPSSARQNTQPSCSSACWMYSRRHGAHSGFVTEVLLADLDGPPGKVLGGAVVTVFFASLLAAGLTLGVGAAGATPVTFADPAGDAGNAPDLTSVVVDNDASGKVSMVISWANAA